MDPITQQQALAAAGAAGGDPVYVDDVFSTDLYVGNDVNGRAINNGIDLSGEGGAVWIKARDVSYNHILQDTVRGATSSLKVNSPNAEETISSRVSGFSSTGFTVGTNANVNATSQQYVSWTFRKAKGFFDVVEFSTTSGFDTVSHSLGSTPGTIIVKRTNDMSPWYVWHRTISSANNYLRLDTSNALIDLGQSAFTSVGASSFGFNSNATVGGGHTCIAYIFAHDDARFGEDGDESIIKCGSYSGTGTYGTFVDVGFEPQWLLVKCTTSGQNWVLIDNMRKFNYNEQQFLYPSSTTVDTETSGWIIPDPRGFTLHGTGALLNSSTEDYIYIAIRRSHKPAENATDVFARYVGQVGNGYAGSPESQGLNMTFPPDLILARRENYSNGSTANGFIHGARYSGSARAYLYDTGSFSVSAGGFAHFDHYPDLHVGDHMGINDNNHRGWFYTFKRAKGFYDTTIYRGTGSAQTVNHNLGVTPELIICKAMNYTDGWAVQAAPLGSGKRLRLDGTNSGANANNYWNSTDPTASVFTVGTDNATNANGYNYIAHLFASQPGVSKIGSYTGNSSANIDIDCGFTNGARFVIVKRTDSTGNWFQWDSYQGIVSGNDSYFTLNTTAGRVTNEDNIDPLSSGFRIPQGASQNLNWTGATYIFLAIA